MISGPGIDYFFVVLFIVLVAALALTNKQADHLPVQSTAAPIDSAALPLNDLRVGGQTTTKGRAAASRRFEVTINDLDRQPLLDPAGRHKKLNH